MKCLRQEVIIGLTRNISQAVDRRLRPRMMDVRSKYEKDGKVPSLRRMNFLREDSKNCKLRLVLSIHGKRVNLSCVGLNIELPAYRCL